MDTINQEHRQKLAKSALSAEHISAMNWRSLPDGRLEIPYLNPDGTEQECRNGKPFKRWRSSQKAIDDAKAKGQKIPKYFSPKGNGCRLYHSPVAIAAGNYQARLYDKYTSIRITEGELKAEAATAYDPERLTIAIGGVNSWRDRYQDGTKSEPIVEFEEIPFNNREVRICFDSDLQKPQVAAALRDLAMFLIGKNAHVLIEILPNGLDGQRLGLDDVIYRHGQEFFINIAKIARFPFKKRREDKHTILEYHFDPQPQDTRERNVYLYGMIGGHWRQSDNAKDHWQQWVETHWMEIAGNDDVSKEVEKFARLQEWKNRELSTITSLLAAFRRTIKAAADNKAAAGLVPFLNGCLVLKNTQFIAHNPDHGNTWCLPYDYNSKAECKGIEAFLLDRLMDSDSVAVFRAFCRALIKSERLKCFLEITGASNTGKTVLGNLIQALVGSANTAAGTLQRLEDRSQRFETLKFKGRRLAIFNECHDYAGQLQTLKALTGDDVIAAEVKNGKHLEFIYRGGVVLVGNGPIKATDQSGAVINRRRSLIVPKVVEAKDEKVMLESDGNGGWCGELTNELAGMVNWVLEMTDAEAKAALSRDVNSLARAEAELETLLATDLLADWADQTLIWMPNNDLRVGGNNEPAEHFLFPSYIKFVQNQGNNCKALSQKTFKAKLVGLLRDTLRLPMPNGNINGGDYRVRLRGSVVPCVGWKTESTDENGIIRFAKLASIGNGRERQSNGKTPVGNGCNGCNGLEAIQVLEKKEPDLFSPIGKCGPLPVTSVTSVSAQGSSHSAAITEPPFAVTQRANGTPIQVQNVKTNEWESGWHQIAGAKGSARALCSNPKGESVQVERKRIRQPTRLPSPHLPSNGETPS